MNDNLHNIVYVVLGVIGAGLTATEVMAQSHQLTLGAPWDVLLPIGMAMIGAIFTLLPQIGWKVPSLPGGTPTVIVTPHEAPTVVVAPASGEPPSAPTK